MRWEIGNRKLEIGMDFLPCDSVLRMSLNWAKKSSEEAEAQKGWGKGLETLLHTGQGKHTYMYINLFIYLASNSLTSKNIDDSLEAVN